MNALTTVAAVVYAFGLWLLAPRTVWEREVKQAKRNQNRRRQTTPQEIKPDCEREIIPPPPPESTHTPNLEPEPVTVPTAEQSIPDAIPDAIPQLDVTEEPEASAQHSELTPQPEAIPESIPDAIPTPPEPETVLTPEQPQPEAEPEPESESIPEPIEQAIPETTGTDYTTWTTTQLREEAKTRKLNWRPLINGKRTPLKKPQLIELLTA